MSVTTASAARPSVARSASAPVDHGSATAITPSMAAIRFEPGADGARDGGVVDVDAVGDDRDLAAGLGEVVELFGDPAGLGARSGAEVEESTENAELPMVPAADEQHDPEGDDRTPAANDQRSE